jgi:hypothetical protein
MAKSRCHRFFGIRLKSGLRRLKLSEIDSHANGGRHVTDCGGGNIDIAATAVGYMPSAGKSPETKKPSFAGLGQTSISMVPAAGLEPATP